MRAAKEVKDETLAIFIVNAVKESHPKIYAKYTVRDYELTFKAILKDINRL